MSRELMPCGTHAAYRRHYLHGEKPCGPCRTASLAYRRRRLNIRAAALEALRHRHAEEFARLLAAAAAEML